MRVLQINKFFFEKGGTERYFFSLSRALEKRGHEVVSFSMQHPDNLSSPQSPYFVSQRDYRARNSALDHIPKSMSFVRSREAARKIQRLIDDTRPDIAHLHNIYHQITPSIIPVLERAGIPMVMTLHDHKLVCPNYSLYDGHSFCFRCKGGRFYHAPLARCNGGSLMRSALLGIEAYWQKHTGVYDSVRFFLTPSRYLRERHIAEGFDEDRVVYLPAFIEDAWGGAEQGTPEENGLPEKYTLYFGRLSAEKGLLTLFEAMKRAVDIPLVVCGDGPLRERLERMASREGFSNVFFTGHLPMGELGGIVERARAVVLPSECPENAPFAILESMALGVPIVVSDLGGLPELAERVGGSVFPAGNARALAERIEELWRDDERAAAIGERSRHVIREEFTVERHMDRLHGIYQSAMASNR
jgi:glycosyltransferase involved in cell wall biosynthesis